jgi:protein SCO1/2
MIALLVFLWIMVGLVPSAVAHDEGSAAPPVSGDPIAGKAGIEQRLNAQVPLDLAFRDERGEAVTLKRYFDGKPVLLALVYYNCDRVCPLVLEGLARSLRPLDLAAGRDYRVVAVSIDPSEGPELAGEKKRVIAARQLRPGAESGWHLLTGAPESIDALARATGFRYTTKNTEKDSERFIHAAATIAVTPEGKIARYFYGFDYPPRELRLSMVEASANRIGSALDQLLLLCYAYDPTQGKYTLSILNVLRFSGAATFLALGGFLVFSLRREHKGATPAGHRSRFRRS